MWISICYYFTAVLCGLGSGIIWTAHGSFVSKAACESNKGFYNAYAWMWAWSSSLIGNPTAAIIIRKGGINGQCILYIFFTFIAFFAVFLFLFVGEPLPPLDE